MRVGYNDMKNNLQKQVSVIIRTPMSEDEEVRTAPSDGSEEKNCRNLLNYFW